jgi:hypothetical protein
MHFPGQCLSFPSHATNRNRVYAVCHKLVSKACELRTTAQHRKGRACSYLNVGATVHTACVAITNMRGSDEFANLKNVAIKSFDELAIAFLRFKLQRIYVALRKATSEAVLLLDDCAKAYTPVWVDAVEGKGAK